VYETRRLGGTTPPLAVAGSIPPGASAQRAPDVDPVAMWHHLLATLRRRRVLFAAVFGGVLGLVALVTLLTPHRFTTEVKLIAGNPGVAVNAAQTQTGLPVLNAFSMPNSAQSPETYAELFSETPVVQQVIDDLKLPTDARTLSTAIKVKPVTNTNVLSLSVTWSDPQTAAKIANDFATVFIGRETELVAGQASTELDFVSKQLPAAELRLRNAATAVSAFETSHNIADLGSQTTATVNAAAGIDAKINAIELEKQQYDAQVASLSGQLAVMRPSTANGGSVVQNPMLPQLSTQLAQVQVQLQSAQAQYTDEHPAVQALKKQVAALQRQIARTPQTVVAAVNTIANPVYQQLQQQLGVARATSASDTAQLAVLQHQRAAINPQLAALPASSARLAELKRREKLAEDVYTALQAKYNDATVARTTALSDVTVTQPASAGMATKTPHVAFNLIAGAIVALLLALGVVFLIDWFDGRIRDERDVEGELGLPVLASVPLLPSGGDGALAIPADVRNAAQESYFQLVLAMRYSSDRPLRTIAVTSPLKGDGKSTVAMHVAGAFGEIAVSSIEREARVLVIDADMRRPSLHKKFGLGNDLGLSDILIGRATLSESVQRSDRPGVDVLTSGANSPNPIKLLQSSRFDALLREARDRYVTVIVDAPALVPVFDAAIVAAKTDGTVMILSADRTDVRSVRKALARLEGVGVNDLLGTVINRAAPRIDDYSDYFETASLKELPSSA
jgi:polysaccharide biosynthesis transport protein